MTAEPDAVTETFAFTCGDCGHAWERTFTLMFFTDPGRPDVQEYLDENDEPLRSPLAVAVCPRCGSRAVRVSSPGSASPGSG